MAMSRGPPMGQTLVPRTEEFSFNRVRSIHEPGYDGFIDNNSLSMPLPHGQSRCQQQPQQIHYNMNSSHYNHNTQGGLYGDPQTFNHQGVQHHVGLTSQIGDVTQVGQHHPMNHHMNEPMTTTAMTTGGHPHDLKTNTLPMPNCRQFGCCGTSCSCAAPEHAMWGHSPMNVSTCQWWRRSQGHPRNLRYADPQVIRPRDKNLSESTRPSGQPYFTHESKDKACVPHQAPKAEPSTFDYNDWLATVQDREAPAHLQGKCIGTVCTLCGPLTIECCPQYNNPLNYMIAKKSC